MSTYTAIHLAKRPTGDIIPGETFEAKQHPIPKEDDLKEGEVIFETNYLSLDPTMRSWLNDVRSYLPPVQIGEIMRGAGLGRIRASRSAAFPVNSLAVSICGWTEQKVLNEKQLEKVELPPNGKATDALGVLGMTGLTAYFGMLDIGQPKPGELVVVSGAAGATGSVAGQIAKLHGARVVGIAGSDEKCAWLTETLGFDRALNYKSPTFAADFRAATESLIDVFYDNVGGEVLDLALARAKPHARFVLCGGISQYNARAQWGPANYLMIVTMRIRMQGFIVFDYAARFPEARKALARWLAEGKIQRRETVVTGGIARAETALVELYRGVNVGKLLVEVKPLEPRLEEAAKGRL